MKRRVKAPALHDRLTKLTYLFLREGFGCRWLLFGCATFQSALRAI